MGDTEVKIRALDAAYKPFPTFGQWASETRVDSVRWERYKSSFQNRAGLSSEVLGRAREIAKRAAALDTGAIEGLYEVDRGFTYTVAFETSAWEAALAEKGAHVRPLFEAQLHAYDYVLDLATKAEPVSEAAIRVLHEEVCRAQPTYRVMTSIGPQEQLLPKGQYKALPNHVRTRKGTDHSYAPVDVTPAEMARLVSELRSGPFLAAHPVIQSAYAHYGLVAIHPFPDGNGRVARALASVFTYRAIAMPIVILAEHQTIYFDALEAADNGEYQPFVDFMLARSLDTIKLVDESVRSALVPSMAESAEVINRLYLTRGGYTVDQVDEVGRELLQMLQKEVADSVGRLKIPKLHTSIGILMSAQTQDSTHRSVAHGAAGFQVVVGTAAPAQAQVVRQCLLWLPRDAAGDDDIQLRADSGDVFVARMDEAIPSVAGVLQIRLKMFAERLLAEMLGELSVLAKKSLRR